jgi:hypothetical protein
MHTPPARAVVALACVLFAATGLHAATVTPTVDSPAAFRATFTGLDTNPQSIGDGNDFQIFVFNYWTVLVNLRGDAVDGDGNASGFYEIQLTHSGSLVSDPTAPVVNTFLVWGPLAPGTLLTDPSSNAQAHGAGSESLSTVTNLTFDPSANVVHYAGSIAGDADLDGDGTADAQATNDVAHTLIELKKAGTITGKQQGQTIKQTNQAKKGGSF